ncbi:YjfI family protein [Gilvimarinus sp. SDUM040013]|uniref:YjfI family protein n=1 Tax=Gilvimarinus gilvus TaxID=3058038 RepID=A0ABU4RZ33_9GAMM|nr:YjfI family protein [Gilvimarinus sp. SDUM040013]MDO3387691.1 YjfI family protein [Gilvimarinus sp. SDUM040013]MDX6848868.1 YjfI family protein [Gilvimarinus sp. SDUM040013]
MKAKSSAHYQREYRKRLREQGLVKKEVWILPENAGQLAELEKLLRERGESFALKGEKSMTERRENSWDTTSLYEALTNTELLTSDMASVELIEGVDKAIHITMKEYGDLPIFLTVAGDQIIVESVLWSVDEVVDVARFNDLILRTHKYFPLSTISLDQMGANGDYYQMFGALSSTSLLHNVVFEIEVLASNVIQATEAYGEHLKLSVAAS